MEWGLGPGSPVEEELQPALAWPRRLRSVASNCKRRTYRLVRTNLTIPASTLPYYSVHAIGGQAELHSSYEEPELLCQGLPRVHRLLSLCRNHYCVRRSVDAPNSEAGTTSEALSTLILSRSASGRQRPSEVLRQRPAREYGCSRCLRRIQTGDVDFSRDLFECRRP